MVSVKSTVRVTRNSTWITPFVSLQIMHVPVLVVCCVLHLTEILTSMAVISGMKMAGSRYLRQQPEPIQRQGNCRKSIVWRSTASVSEQPAKRLSPTTTLLPQLCPMVISLAIDQQWWATRRDVQRRSRSNDTCRLVARDSVTTHLAASVRSSGSALRTRQLGDCGRGWWSGDFKRWAACVVAVELKNRQN